MLKQKTFTGVRVKFWWIPDCISNSETTAIGPGENQRSGRPLPARSQPKHGLFYSMAIPWESRNT